MRLTRLEMKGFKSFRDKTVLAFPDKYMGVVGPNGSGKSNITEAICFVLGKSRGLRAANLQELIFNGAIGGQPASKAVVALTLKEDDGTKHKITRIVDREGHSVYKLNDKKSTRQRILEIVGDSEYNIILQDDITKVVEMKPRDRRKIIDDMCGIGVYDDKRDKALRELDKVEERITQTHIILGEKQGYMHELKKERDEAVKYVEVRDELRGCRATLLYKDIQSQQRRCEKLDELTKEITDGRQKRLKEIADTRGEVKDKGGRLREISSELIKLEEERRGDKIAETQGEILRLEDRQGMLGDQEQALGEEEKQRKERLSDIKALRRQAEQEMDALTVRGQTMSREVQAEAAKTVDLTVETELDEVKNRIYEARSNMKALTGVNEGKAGELNTLNTERERLEGEVKKLVTSEQTKLKDVSKIQADYERAMSEFKKFETDYSSANEAINLTQGRLEEQRIILGKKESELATIQRASGGLHQAVKAVVGLKKVIPGIHGPVVQLGQVSEQKYSLPLQVSAGARMQYVAVDSVDDAAKCIDYLRKKQIGRCTFLPINKLNFKSQGKPPAEAIGFAREFIKSSSKFKKIFEYVFGDTIIVRDIQTAKKIGIGSWRMVTLDGDLLELSGAMTGGHMPKRYEITFTNTEELEAEVEGLKGHLSTLEDDYGKAMEHRRKLDATLMKLRENLRKTKEELDSTSHGKDLESERRGGFRERLAQVVDSIKAIEGEVADNSLEAKKLEKTAQADEKRLTELAGKRGEGDVTKLDTLKDGLRDVEVAKTKLTEKLTFLIQQADELTARLTEIAGFRKEYADEIAELKGKAAELGKSLGGLKQTRDSVGGAIDELIAERGRVEEELTALSSKIGELEGGMEGLSQRLNEYVIEKTKITTHLEDLEREYGKYEGVELIEKSVKDLADRAAKLEEKLTDFGSVNMRAIETYDVIKAEFDDIMSKLETLKTERQSIFDFMDKIESKKKVTFMEAFDKVKENFERIFAELSDGKGTFILDNPLNISESGLLIKASPGGKRLMSLDAMSGGEKVLTSSAFLLALQQYKPAFFYVVDELDAALDKRNSIRLAEMLAASGGQFLMVTHNNSMLKYMDSAIGVSMVQGVSQIVGVRFNGEVPEDTAA